MAEQVGSGSSAGSTLEGLRSHACTICQRRKVKCDRKDPCSNCASAEAECVYRDPLPPRRRKKAQQPDAMLMARLRRCEDTLKKIGIDPDAVSSGSRAPLPFPGNREVHAGTHAVPIERKPAQAVHFSSDTPPHGSGKLVAKDGSSIYFHSDLWKNTISNELQNAAVDILPESSDGVGGESVKEQPEDSDFNADSLVFETATRHRLTELHPDPVHLFKLWQVFLDNVNPVTKIVHAPTLQQQVLAACGDLSSVPKELEALMFSIYCAAVTSLKDEAVLRDFGEQRTKLLRRYRQGAQHALINASVLKTSNMMVLQALILFILSVRPVYDPHALWSLSGIAVRIAQRTGLHRDSSRFGLSVFETEMRRRLWWQIVTVDAIIGHASGFASSISPDSDTRIPLNVNDSDLNPDMKESPVESTGATEMIFCLARYEFGQWLLRRAASRSGGLSSYWEFFPDAPRSQQEKDQDIKELENALEEKYARFCDPSIPLHLITLVVTRSMIPLVRLSAHHPRIYQEKGETQSQYEKDRLFAGCITVAEHSSILLNAEKVQKYRFHLDYHFPWASYIYMLSELRHRTVGDEIANAWRLIDAACSDQYQQLKPRERSPLHLAVANLGIKAWAAHVAESDRRQLPCLPKPNIITTFRELIQRAKPISSSSYSSATGNPQIATASSLATVEGPQRHEDGRPVREPSFPPEATGAHTYEPSESFTESTLSTNLGSGDFDVLPEIDVPAPEDSPMDWVQWDELVQQFHQQHGNTGTFSGS